MFNEYLALSLWNKIWSNSEALYNNNAFYKTRVKTFSVQTANAPTNHGLWAAWSDLFRAISLKWSIKSLRIFFGWIDFFDEYKFPLSRNGNNQTCQIWVRVSETSIPIATDFISYYRFMRPGAKRSNWTVYFGNQKVEGESYQNMVRS